MLGRNKVPKYNINKNVLVIGGSGSGKTRFHEGTAAKGDTALSASGRASLGNCPRCGKPVYEGKKSFYCSGYKDTPPCGFVLWKDNPYFRSKRKELTKEVAAALLRDGKVNMKGLYSEKKGGFYDAAIVLDDTGGKYVNFKLEFGKENQIPSRRQ